MRRECMVNKCAYSKNIFGNRGHISKGTGIFVLNLIRGAWAEIKFLGIDSLYSMRDSMILWATSSAISIVSAIVRPWAISPWRKELVAKYSPSFRGSMDMGMRYSDIFSPQYEDSMKRISDQATGKVNACVCCAGDESGIYLCPRKSREEIRRIITLTEQLKSFYSPLSGCEQLINPRTNESTIIEKITHLKPPTSSLKKPLTQAATTVSLKISKNALAIRSRLCSLKNFIELNVPFSFVSVKRFERVGSTSYKFQVTGFRFPAGGGSAFGGKLAACNL